MVSFHFQLLLVSILPYTTFAAYQLLQDYSGDAFFEGFDFFTDPDPTDGHVEYQSMSAANASGIAGFMQGGNATKAIYLGVDSANDAPNGRGSVRVQSSQTFQHALVIADIVHSPGGICGTWPAFWMVGADWPNNGEIDIVEGVNDQTSNSMTLHTNKGAVVHNGTNFHGELVTADCDVGSPNQPLNVGCSIEDNSGLTFGSGFNAAGGGVYATEWTSQSIKIWFFPRGSFPEDIASASPRPGEDWGTPRSVFQGDFEMDKHFRDLQIVFDTTFCGVWAGAVWNTSSCASLAPTCEDYVSNNPSAFEDAYWAINTLQVFEDDGQGISSSTNTPAVTETIRKRSGGAVLAKKYS